MTSGFLSAEQAKAKNILAMGQELGAVYDALWQQVALLHRQWSEYIVLFGTKESRVSLLNEAAPSFTRIIQDSLWESILLHIARLTDPPKSSGKPNLSVRALSSLVSHSEIKLTVESRSKEALLAAEFCRDWRNRRIAHRDLGLALEKGAEPLKPATILKVEDALNALSAVLNTISIKYLDSTTFFELDTKSGGAMSLLLVIDAGLHAERARYKRRRAGTGNADDYKQRNL